MHHARAIDTRQRQGVSTPPQGLAAAADRSQVPSGSRPAWYVVASLPKAERRAHASLHQFGFEAYLPLLTIRWRDRTWHTVPLFPGYLFCLLDLAQPWHPVRYAPGVFNLINIGGIPIPCPRGVVEAILAGEALRRIPTPPEALWTPGAACRLAGGGLSGQEGVILNVGKHNAVVALMLFGHLREVSVDLDALAPIKTG